MIQINLDSKPWHKNVSVPALAELIDLTPANLSILKIIEPKQFAFQLNALAENWNANLAIY